MSKKNKNGNLLFLIFLICFSIASINMFSLKNKTISKKSSSDNINKILSKELSDEISILKTEKDSNNLYALYKNSNNHYSLASFKRNNLLYNRYEFNENLINDNIKKFNFLSFKNDTSSKIILFGDFSRTTASLIKITCGDEVKEVSLNKKEPIIKIIDFPLKDSNDVTVQVFDEFQNEISNAL